MVESGKHDRITSSSSWAFSSLFHDIHIYFLKFRCHRMCLSAHRQTDRHMDSQAPTGTGGWSGFVKVPLSHPKGCQGCPPHMTPPVRDWWEAAMLPSGIIGWSLNAECQARQWVPFLWSVVWLGREQEDRNGRKLQRRGVMWCSIPEGELLASLQASHSIFFVMLHDNDDLLGCLSLSAVTSSTTPTPRIKCSAIPFIRAALQKLNRGVKMCSSPLLSHMLWRRRRQHQNITWRGWEVKRGHCSRG